MLIDRTLRCLTSAPALLAVLTLSTTVHAADIDFNRDIRPILSDKCFFCHGPDSHERQADLRLDTFDGATADFGGYQPIKPGDLENSEVVARILSDDPDTLMPPPDSHKSLKPSEIDLLKQWIAEGAEYAEAWAYVPPIKRDAPQVKDGSWPRNWIDRFVLARLDQEGLTPSPDADRVTLVRRLHFDLTGLPPTADEAKSFVEDKRPLDDVIADRVDKLLSSPHFGERLAIYWLDLVRFADTCGYHGDQDHNISPYRDYVIKAFNENVPFDQFTREQLAGDLLPDPTKWQKVASGYNRLLQTSHEGGIQKKEYDAIYAADRVRNVSAVWMGATVGCAQCHDHKYDPYTTKDFYSLGAFFADVRDDNYSGNSLPTNRPPEMYFFIDEQESEIAAIQTELDQLATKAERDRLAKLRGELTRQEAALKKQKDETKKKTIATKIAELSKKYAAIKTDEIRKRIVALNSRRVQIDREARKTMIVVAKEPREMRILPRGNWLDDSGEIVSSAIPEFMGSLDTSDRATRLDLANWLTDPANGTGGLTARVFANRFWYLFFGTGISRSLEDFGGQGEPPANPELLDQLAVSFYENGWDVKAVVRDIVTSRAYRQSSIASDELLARDPDNQLVARQSRYRLPAEMIRDQALAVSGLLNPTVGGASVKPYQPVGYYRHLNFPQRKYKQHDDNRQYRRGLYVHWQRMFLHPMMKAMDAPSREECTAQRPRSNTPTAALVLLNDPSFVEAARVFAERIITDGGSDTASRIQFAFNAALSRDADADELAALTELLTITQTEYDANPMAVNEVLSVGLKPPAKDIDKTELASWTAIARAVLNLNETTTRN